LVPESHFSPLFTEILALWYSKRVHVCSTDPATMDITFMPAVQKVFESYCNSVLGVRTGIARNRERLKPKNVTILNCSPAVIICFHFPKNTTQQIFWMLYASCIMCRSPFINQTLCTTRCILNHISFTAPKRFGVHWQNPQWDPSNCKHTHTHTHDAITAHKFVGPHPVWDGIGSLKDTKDVTKIDAIAPTFHICLVFITSF